MHDFGIIIHEVHDLWKYKSDLIDAGKLLKNSVVSCNSLKTKEIKIDFGGKVRTGSFCVEVAYLLISLQRINIQKNESYNYNYNVVRI